jgi:hypothetical protein
MVANPKRRPCMSCSGLLGVDPGPAAGRRVADDVIAPARCSESPRSTAKATARSAPRRLPQTSVTGSTKPRAVTYPRSTVRTMSYSPKRHYGYHRPCRRQLTSSESLAFVRPCFEYMRERPDMRARTTSGRSSVGKRPAQAAVRQLLRHVLDESDLSDAAV